MQKGQKFAKSGHTGCTSLVSFSSYSRSQFCANLFAHVWEVWPVGIFLKYLGNKFSCQGCQNNWQFLGHYEKFVSYLSKYCCSHFWQHFGKNRATFILTSGRTAHEWMDALPSLRQIVKRQFWSPRIFRHFCKILDLSFLGNCEGILRYQCELVFRQLSKFLRPVETIYWPKLPK